MVLDGAGDVGGFPVISGDRLAWGLTTPSSRADHSPDCFRFVLDALRSAVNRRYLKVRQQYRHAQALWADVRTGDEALPVPRFVLFGRGRSGTTALISMLDDVPALDCEGEVLHDWVPFPERHVRGRCARSPGPGYGCKILSYQIRDVQTRLARPTSVLRRLHEQHGVRILYLRRTNLLRHALSNIRARREQFHRKKGEDPAQRRALRVDPDNVLAWMRSSEALKEYEERLLEGVPHLSLTYEQHLRDAEQHQPTVDTVCSFLGVASAAVESSYEKVAPPSPRDGVANYDALARRLRETPYASYLD